MTDVIVFMERVGLAVRFVGEAFRDIAIDIKRPEGRADVSHFAASFKAPTTLLV